MFVCLFLACDDDSYNSYKASTGNHECLKCGANAKSDMPRRVECTCKHSYKRIIGKSGSQDDCYSKFEVKISIYLVYKCLESKTYFKFEISQTDQHICQSKLCLDKLVLANYFFKPRFS